MAQLVRGPLESGFHALWSAPGVAVITNWFGNTTASASTAGPFRTQLTALICWAMNCRMDATVVCVSVPSADLSELSDG
jgi:hypothetical protein